MGENFPNTETVRAAYIRGQDHHQDLDGLTQYYAGADFDRWLADHDATLLENARTTLEEDRLYIKRLEDRYSDTVSRNFEDEG